MTRKIESMLNQKNFRGKHGSISSESYLTFQQGIAFFSGIKKKKYE